MKTSKRFKQGRERADNCVGKLNAGQFLKKWSSILRMHFFIRRIRNNNLGRTRSIVVEEVILNKSGKSVDNNEEVKISNWKMEQKDIFVNKK